MHDCIYDILHCEIIYDYMLMICYFSSFFYDKLASLLETSLFVNVLFIYLQHVRERFNFSPRERVTMSDLLQKVHVDDRENVKRFLHEMKFAG